MHPARIEKNDVFLWFPQVSLCYEVLPFIFDYQLNRDNSAVLVVSPLLLLMMDEVDGVEAETGGLERHCARTELTMLHQTLPMQFNIDQRHFLLFSRVFCNTCVNGSY